MPKCFVVQGFGVKTDFESGRSLDLDASYEVIKSAVEDAGLECIRADEVQHSGVIDRPMYQYLYEADLVVADISTSNLNAAYELGVRHALRPFRTIVVAEDQFSFPFDISRNAIRSYKHLGEDIGRREAERFRASLSEAIRSIMDMENVDSPLYTYMSELDPPRLADDREGVVPSPAPAMADGAEGGGMAPLLAGFRSAKSSGDWASAKLFLTRLRAERPDDSYFAQQLALATYKEFDKQSGPPRVAALQAATAILEALDPESTHDTETLGLWGAIHKRLLEEQPDEMSHLEQALSALGRAFALKADYYNGINFAYMLNVRVRRAQSEGRVADAIADWVTAERVRRQVIAVCLKQLGSTATDTGDAGELLPDAEYWLPATVWEACVGLGYAESSS